MAKIGPNGHYQFPVKALFAVGFGLLLPSTWLSSRLAFAQEAYAAPTVPKGMQPPENLGDLHMVHGEYQAAVQAYTSVSEPSADLLNKLGFAYQHLYAIDKAKAAFERALRARPNFPQALNNLGAIFFQERQFGKAEQMYKRALRLAPKDATVARNLAETYIAEGDVKRGEETYQIALQNDPDIFSDGDQGVQVVFGTPQVRSNQNYCLAALFARAGHLSQALEYLRKAIDAGFGDAKRIARDPDFAALRSAPEFAQLMSQARKRH